MEKLTGKAGACCGSAGLPCYTDEFDLKHGNTMIVATNKAEFAFIIAWCDMINVMSPWMGDREDFPIALSPNGGGWTDGMDRAVYYVRFADFIGAV